MLLDSSIYCNISGFFCNFAQKFSRKIEIRFLKIKSPAESKLNTEKIRIKIK